MARTKALGSNMFIKHKSLLANDSDTAELLVIMITSEKPVKMDTAFNVLRIESAILKCSFESDQNTPQDIFMHQLTF